MESNDNTCNRKKKRVKTFHKSISLPKEKKTIDVILFRFCALNFRIKKQSKFRTLSNSKLSTTLDEI